MTIYIKLALEMSDKDGMENKWFGNNWVFFEKSKKQIPSSYHQAKTNFKWIKYLNIKTLKKTKKTIL